MTRYQYVIWLIQLAADQSVLKFVFEPLGGWLLEKRDAGEKLPPEPMKKMIGGLEQNQNLIGNARLIFGELRKRI